jgi:rhamnopyranosyl-N-acetylglucosaminyl-diphospho-decaprenol beta-1,3/1,4-galactofuranosyltransferase
LALEVLRAGTESDEGVLMRASDVQVAAVIVTFNRRDVLARTLASVVQQSRRPDLLVVVDNDGDDGTDAMLAAQHPEVDYLRMPENLGFAAGLTAGMEYTLNEGVDFFWLLDDDSTPEPDCLERLLKVSARIEDCGVVGLSGGRLRHGVPDRRTPLPLVVDVFDGQLRVADFVLVDGALVRAAAARDAGFPRADFFMMMEDVEYTSRLKRHGWQILLLDADLLDRGHLGSGANTGSAPPWRGYYQSRNHLAVALQRRSLGEIWGWLVRQAKFSLGALLGSDRRLRRVYLRLLGGVDALRGRMGRTIEPVDDLTSVRPRR